MWTLVFIIGCSIVSTYIWYKNTDENDNDFYLSDFENNDEYYGSNDNDDDLVHSEVEMIVMKATNY